MPVQPGGAPWKPSLDEVLAWLGAVAWAEKRDLAREVGRRLGGSKVRDVVRPQVERVGMYLRSCPWPEVRAGTTDRDRFRRLAGKLFPQDAALPWEDRWLLAALARHLDDRRARGVPDPVALRQFAEHPTRAFGEAMGKARPQEVHSASLGADVAALIAAFDPHLVAAGPEAFRGLPDARARFHALAADVTGKRGLQGQEFTRAECRLYAAVAHHLDTAAPRGGGAEKAALAAFAADPEAAVRALAAPASEERRFLASVSDLERVLGEAGATGPFLAVRADRAGATLVEREDAAELAARIARAPGPVHLVIEGREQTGKSCFLALLARAWLRHPGRRVLYLDHAPDEPTLRRAAKEDALVVADLSDPQCHLPADQYRRVLGGARRFVLVRRPGEPFDQSPGDEELRRLIDTHFPALHGAVVADPAAAPAVGRVPLPPFPAAKLEPLVEALGRRHGVRVPEPQLVLELLGPGEAPGASGLGLLHLFFAVAAGEGLADAQGGGSPDPVAVRRLLEDLPRRASGRADAEHLVERLIGHVPADARGFLRVCGALRSLGLRSPWFDITLEQAWEVGAPSGSLAWPDAARALRRRWLLAPAGDAGDDLDEPVPLWDLALRDEQLALLAGPRTHARAGLETARRLADRAEDPTLDPARRSAAALDAGTLLLHAWLDARTAELAEEGVRLLAVAERGPVPATRLRSRDPMVSETNRVSAFVIGRVATEAIAKGRDAQGDIHSLAEAARRAAQRLKAGGREAEALVAADLAARALLVAFRAEVRKAIGRPGAAARCLAAWRAAEGHLTMEARANAGADLLIAPWIHGEKPVRESAAWLKEMAPDVLGEPPDEQTWAHVIGLAVAGVLARPTAEGGWERQQGWIEALMGLPKPRLPGHLDEDEADAERSNQLMWVLGITSYALATLPEAPPLTGPPAAALNRALGPYLSSDGPSYVAAWALVGAFLQSAWRTPEQRDAALAPSLKEFRETSGGPEVSMLAGCLGLALARVLWGGRDSDRYEALLVEAVQSFLPRALPPGTAIPVRQVLMASFYDHRLAEGSPYLSTGLRAIAAMAAEFSPTDAAERARLWAALAGTALPLRDDEAWVAEIVDMLDTHAADEGAAEASTWAVWDEFLPIALQAVADGPPGSASPRWRALAHAAAARLRPSQGSIWLEAWSLAAVRVIAKDAEATPGTTLSAQAVQLLDQLLVEAAETPLAPGRSREAGLSILLGETIAGVAEAPDPEVSRAWTAHLLDRARAAADPFQTAEFALAALASSPTAWAKGTDAAAATAVLCWRQAEAGGAGLEDVVRRAEAIVGRPLSEWHRAFLERTRTAAKSTG